MAEVDYDTELRRYATVLRQAWSVRPTDRVLDIGCGAGTTTRDAARLAFDGSALGIDLVAPAPADLPNLTFVQGDAQTYPFPTAAFDLAISRFGTMFFADPVSAFANIARSLRPGGRLVMLVWQAYEHNAWSTSLHGALGTSPLQSAFSLGDPALTTLLLSSAGFVDVRFTDVAEPVYYGPSVTAALTWVRRFAAVRHLDEAALEGALDRLREMLAAHLGDDGVWFDARAWLVTARR
ncbi:methyltransferase domain-containing protein [Dactylosporangium aurantiacum]|uniref:Methyltransferase domain-containing protein n=1 Tax=Dactylosporangium aurantiacum TaxID=35754 RepID=A0A9Q9IK61_9ACTN|nr:class I SAM-dependent methyltransferase [Dactylosporangium aurantiacum]MDG6107477.1 methyltransferase domain-containing protein [Dactylosporangium aurantiacum]UWZ54270.1 methyltransferase domain-containing protein [Dactylosporangium aurantiacum]